jgi:hypothetical protein
MALDKVNLGRAIAEVRELPGLTPAERARLTVNRLSLADITVSPEALTRWLADMHARLDAVALWLSEARRPGEDAQAAQVIELTRKVMRAAIACATRR